jgi:hypothetical protein
MEVILPAPPMRFVILHYHIFKNAGSTIAAILEREFKGRFVSLHGPSACSILSNNQVGNFLDEHRGVAALTSHHFRYPKPQIPYYVVFDWCLLRHPLNRIASLYTYYRQIESDDPLCPIARTRSARGFVRELIEHYPNVVSNAQVNLLGQSGCFTRPPGPTDLEHAKRVLRQMAIPGVVESFAESMIAAEYFLRPAFPDLKLHYVQLNQSRPPSGAGSPSEPDYWDLLWGADLSSHLLQLNDLDVSLHAAASAEVQRRLRLVPNFAERMCAFQRRCGHLERAA